MAYDDGACGSGLAGRVVLGAVVDDDDVGEGLAGLGDDLAHDGGLVVQGDDEPGVSDLRHRIRRSGLRHVGGSHLRILARDDAVSGLLRAPSRWSLVG